MNVSDVFQTMQATFGSSYINDFNLYGRTFRVYTQSEKDYRARPEDLAEVYVRNKQDEMIPLTALINVKPTSGPQTVERFNNFQALSLIHISTPKALGRLSEKPASAYRTPIEPPMRMPRRRKCRMISLSLTIYEYRTLFSRYGTCYRPTEMRSFE